MSKLKYLPKFLRIRLIRQNINIHVPPEDFQVNIASTKEELEKAYALLHDCYVGIKLMAPDPSGLRCNFYSFLPNTTTVVAKIGNQVVGTVSLIKDSPAGLPSDKDFRAENDQLRATGHRLVEVSSLAIDANFRKKAHVVSIYLMKYLKHYTVKYMGCTTVTCVVHPRARDFYEAFWGFKASKKIIKYKFVNGALGVQTGGDITDLSLMPLEKYFPKDADRNPISFLYRDDKCLVYPARKIENHLDPIYTPQLLKYFLAERTEAYKSLTRNELIRIYSSYSLFFEKLEEMEFFQQLVSPTVKKRYFRFPAKIQAVVYDQSTQQTVGHIMDISQEGAFFATHLDLELHSNYRIDFRLGNDKFSVPISVRWKNSETKSHQLLGYGIQFRQTQAEISNVLRRTHFSALAESEASAQQLEKLAG